MSYYRLYALPIPDSAQIQTGSNTQQQLALAGAIDEDFSTVSQQGSDPNEQTLEWNYRGRRAAMIAKELEELADASGVDTVPLYATGGSSDADGYYAIESADVSRAAPQQDEVWVANVTLRREGRRGSHYRSTDCTIVQLDNPFGNDQTAPVAVHADAETLQWTDGLGARLPVSSSAELETRSGEFADVMLYDAREAPYEDPTLCYSLSFEAEMKANPVLWDTRENDSKPDGDSNRQWQHVFSTEHDPEGAFVFDSTLVRLFVDASASDPADQLSAETWDGSSWSSVSLGDPGEWSLFEIDVSRAADDRLEAQLTFSDGSQFSELDMQVALGADAVLFTLPDSGPLPDGLEDWLSPIAAEYVYGCQPALSVTPKREVRA